MSAGTAVFSQKNAGAPPQALPEGMIPSGLLNLGGEDIRYKEKAGCTYSAGRPFVLQSEV